MRKIALVLAVSLVLFSLVMIDNVSAACEGTPVDCEDIEYGPGVQESQCEAVQGCSWTGIFTRSCIGTPEPCSVYSTKSECEAIQGCSFTYDWNFEITGTETGGQTNKDVLIRADCEGHTKQCAIRENLYTPAYGIEYECPYYDEDCIDIWNWCNRFYKGEIYTSVLDNFIDDFNTRNNCQDSEWTLPSLLDLKGTCNICVAFSNENVCTPERICYKRDIPRTKNIYGDIGTITISDGNKVLYNESNVYDGMTPLGGDLINIQKKLNYDSASYLLNYTIDANDTLTITGCLDENQNSVCDYSECIPETCESLGKECGNWDDGCGNTLNCGGCLSGEICSDGTCIPETAPYWADMAGNPITDAEKGDTVKMIWENSGLTPGTSVDINIKEADTITADDDIKTITGNVDANGKVTGQWTITQEDYNKTNDHDKFYFEIVTEKSNEIPISETENNEAPNAEIVKPKDGDIYFMNDIISFNQTSYDVDDEISVEWNFGDGTTSTGYNATHSYSSSGQKQIILTVTDSRGKTDSDSVNIMILEEGENILAFIDEPKYGSNVNNPINFNASSTYIINYTLNGNTRDLTCLSGNCPSETADGTTINDNLANDNTRYDKIKYSWEFCDNSKIEKIGYEGVIFDKEIRIGGNCLVILNASSVSSKKYSITSTEFDISYSDPYCTDDGDNWILSDGTYIDSHYDCHKENVAEGSSDDCCPKNYICQNDRCVENLNIEYCSDYNNEQDCNNDPANVGKSSVEELSGYIQGEVIDTKLVNGEECNVLVVNFRCEWDVDSKNCTATNDEELICGGYSTGTTDGCLWILDIETECNEVGEKTVSYIAIWEGEGEAPDYCSDYNNKIKCLSGALLNFFDIRSLIISIMILTFFYLIMNKKNKKES